MKQRAQIIGAGIGGLATAIQLARKGFSVTVWEKNATPGGRCAQLSRDGHIFDTGPTMYLFPEIYEDFFKSIGEDIHKHLALLRVHPTFKLFFTDRPPLTLHPDAERMRKELEAVEPGSYIKYLKYIDDAKKHYDLAMQHITTKSLDNARDFFNLSNAYRAIKTGAFVSHYSFIRKYFRDEALRAAFTFQDSYLSLNPYTAPAVFSLLSYGELVNGSYLPRGGMYKIIQALVHIAEKNGVQIIYNHPVDTIPTESKDIIVVNKEIHRPRKQYSCSAMLFHWALQRRIPNLATHNLFFSKSIKDGFDKVIGGREPPDEPHFYIQAPARTDATRAPHRGDTLTAIVPINHINDGHPVDWNSYTDHVRRYIFSRLPDVQKHIKFEFCFRPEDWQTRFSLPYGAIYGLHHNLSQLGYFRSPRQDKNNRNVFYVGASTHPGSGLPTVLLSSRFTTQKILAFRGIH